MCAAVNRPCVWVEIRRGRAVVEADLFESGRRLTDTGLAAAADWIQKYRPREFGYGDCVIAALSMPDHLAPAAAMDLVRILKRRENWRQHP